MEPLRVYSSQPVGLKLACAFLALGSQAVVELPLSALPAPASPPRRRDTLADDLARVSLRLAEIGDQLNDHEHGRCRLEVGLEQGLRSERDTLQSRQRGLVASLRAQKGGPHNG